MAKKITVQQPLHFSAANEKEAWEIVNKHFPTDYEKDEIGSVNAGYPIYRSTSKSLPNASYNYICDLCTRIEINLVDAKWNPTTIMVDIDKTKRTSKGFRICSTGC